MSEFIFRSEKIKQKLAQYGIVNNKTVYSILNESIYHLESLFDYDDITLEILDKEAKSLSETLHKYHYPRKIRNAAIVEFYKYFSFVNEK